MPLLHGTPSQWPTPAQVLTCSTTHSTQFGAQMPTRSPFCGREEPLVAHVQRATPHQLLLGCRKLDLPARSSSHAV